jgi:aromatic ring-opening dioxygenase catalytic subunit (LigB family)
MVVTLEHIASSIQKPDAIIVVSAHWEEGIPTITSGSSPSLIYDYYGFPEKSYSIKYPCAGEPSLAQKTYKLLNNSGIQAMMDDKRGFDHGLFVPLKIMYPAADIPSIQVSLVNTLDPYLHIQVGQALRALTRDNVLIIGSGFSFHNLKAFFSPDTNESREMNQSFEDWLLKTCCSEDYSEEQRTKILISWGTAPSAHFCHPREEHLLPLHVCYGVAQTMCSDWFELRIMNKKSSMYLWSE